MYTHMHAHTHMYMYIHTYTYVYVCMYNTQGEAKVDLQFFVWKIINTNNNTRINSVLCTHECKPTFPPLCMYRHARFQ